MIEEKEERRDHGEEIVHNREERQYRGERGR